MLDIILVMSDKPSAMLYDHIVNSYRSRVADDLRTLQAETELALRRAAVPDPELGALTLLQVSVNKIKQAADHLAVNMAALDALHRVEGAVDR